MASSVEGYTLGWNEYANNFSISLTDLLKQKELVDVTLVADGHLFNAHRLVLSALSPYFRHMFAQMPVNQQAFVFLKDVPKAILDKLITFIYSGQVSVEQEHLEEFFNIAKALDIKGLADGGYANPSHVQSPIFNSSKPTFDGMPGMQYQSTRTTRVPDQVNTNRNGQSHYEQPANSLHQPQDNSDYEVTNEMNDTGDNYSNSYNYECYGSENSIGEPLDPNHGAQANQWNTSYEYDVEEQQAKPNVINPPKRVKINNDMSEYRIIADIQLNDNNKENLFHNGNKFNKSNQPNLYGQQRWSCTKRTTLNKCKAAVSTMDVNGVVMMKVINDEHSH